MNLKRSHILFNFTVNTIHIRHAMEIEKCISEQNANTAFLPSRKTAQKWQMVQCNQISGAENWIVING